MPNSQLPLVTRLRSAPTSARVLCFHRGLMLKLAVVCVAVVSFGTLASTASAIVTRTTSTTVACTPAAVLLTLPTTCTATVTDTASGTKTTPTGVASFSNGSAPGLFVPVNCTLIAGTTGVAACTVIYTPSGAGSPAITASYGGDLTHSTSTSNAFILSALAPNHNILWGVSCASAS